MDGTSPGNMPVSLGQVWVGEVQSCIVDWPQWQSPYQPAGWHFTPMPITFTPRLSDDDVERIARRVAELLREPRP